MWPCLSDHPQGVTLRVRATPNAARSEAQGLRDKSLRVRLQAPPAEGKANRALCEWVARVFGVRPRRIEIVRGEKGRDKVLLITGLSVEEAGQALEKLGLTRP